MHVQLRGCFVENLRNLQNLQSVTIGFKDVEVEEFMQKRIFESLQRLEYLEIMVIEYRKCRLNFKYCSWSLNPNLKSVKFDFGMSDLDEKKL